MKLHFIGIGGAGMAPLARIALERGHLVSGSDNESNRKTAELAAAGAKVYCGHRAEQLPPDAELVVYSSAVSQANPELAAALARGVRTLRRGAFLAEFANGCARTVAVSGSHGKTSVTAMLGWILFRTRPDAGWLIGGEVHGFPAARAGSGDIFVTEVDESDGTHVLVRPWCGVVPNVDDDHDWSVGGAGQLRENFARFGAQSGQLLYFDEPQARALYRELPQASAVSAADLPPSAPLAGYMRLNGALARRAALALGLEAAAVDEALCCYPGVERRLTVRGRAGRLTVIEDYAHHPAELAQSISTLRELYPGRRLEVIFQPHRYARLAKYFDRLAQELRQADSVTVVPVFAAWCETGTVGGAELAQAVGPAARYSTESWEALGRRLSETPREAETVLAVIGAGDIGELLRYLPGRA